MSDRELPLPSDEVSQAEHREPTRGWSWRRRIGVAVVVVLVLVVGYGCLSFWQVHSTGRSDEARPVDAIVVLGAAQYDLSLIHISEPTRRH